MCHYYDMDQEYETVKDWYNGYTFGQTDIYNPWSVIQYLSDARVNHNWLPMSYWANTSSNSIVKTLIDRAEDEEKEKIEALLAGGTIVVQIHEDITYNEIYDEGDNLWNFMFSPVISKGQGMDRGGDHLCGAYYSKIKRFGIFLVRRCRNGFAKA